MRGWSMRLLYLLAVLVCGCLALEQSVPLRATKNNPVADARAVVVQGKARFTILTKRMVRLEWQERGIFEDRASFGVLNRRLTPPAFTKQFTNNVLTIKTEALTIIYNATNNANFSDSNLQITVNGLDGITAKWIPSAKNAGNLLGTVRTLDGINGAVELDCAKQPRSDLHCTYGLISTSGWSLSDESPRPLFDNNTEWSWIHARPFNNTDWYFFGHGLNYKQALADYTLIGDQIPLPPRYSFGIWFSRYWAYSDMEYMELVREYQEHDVPLDVLVTDMDWHLTFYKEASEGKRDQAGQQPGWTGFTWDPRLFPNPDAFLAWCKSKNLKNTLNLHPASGVQPFEARYPQMAVASGIDPKSNRYVPYTPENQTFVNNLWNIMLQPFQNQGIDFWWLDWQQGEDWETMPGLNPTFLLNYIFFTIPQQWKEGRRPMLLHRWGGLGNHRYQIGFTGDVVPSWGSLAFQPYFTATAANVGFGFWSHDIGGHTEPEHNELYTRWIQWGAFSPIFRPHCTKNPENDRRIWVFPYNYEAIMRDYLILRASLVPYIYTASRISHDTGISLIRPLYYDLPAEPRAYQYHTEYHFGDDIIVSPVVDPMDPKTNLSTVKVFVPSGTWVEWFSGRTYTGLTQISNTYALDEMPVFVKNGAIIPTVDPRDRDLFGSAQFVPTTLSFIVFVGTATSGSTSVYEDDGKTTDYLSNSNTGYAWTNISFTRVAQSSLTVTIPAPSGSYTNMPTSRGYRAQLRGLQPPASVQVNSRSVPFDMSDSAIPSWSYDGETGTIRVNTNTFTVSTPTTIHVTFQNQDLLPAGFPLAVRRLKAVKTLLDYNFPTVFQEQYNNVIYGASFGQQMSFVPSKSKDLLPAFPAVFKAAQSEVMALNSSVVNAQVVAQVRAYLDISL